MSNSQKPSTSTTESARHKFAAARFYFLIHKTTNTRESTARKQWPTKFKTHLSKHNVQQAKLSHLLQMRIRYAEFYSTQPELPGPHLQVVEMGDSRSKLGTSSCCQFLDVPKKLETHISGCCKKLETWGQHLQSASTHANLSKILYSKLQLG